MGDAEYLAAFQQIVMPIAYEVWQFVSVRSSKAFNTSLQL